MEPALRLVCELRLQEPGNVALQFGYIQIASIPRAICCAQRCNVGLSIFSDAFRYNFAAGQ
jgi:hypothetical protein